MSPLSATQEARNRSGPDRRIWALLIATAIAGVVTAVLVAVAVPVVLSTETSIQGQERSNELRGCTSTLATLLVSGPQAAALKALATEGQNSAAFREATDRLEPERYEQLTKLALTDEDEFLRKCRQITRDSDD